MCLEVTVVRCLHTQLSNQTFVWNNEWYITAISQRLIFLTRSLDSSSPLRYMSIMCFFVFESFLWSLTFCFPRIPKTMSNFVPGLVFSSSPMFSYTRDNSDASWVTGRCSNNAIPICQANKHISNYVFTADPNTAGVNFSPINVNKGELQR
jgi:hypothetical protein